MNFPLSDEEIWYWYQQIEISTKQNMLPTEFCRKNNLNYQRFSNLKYRIHFKKNNPELYKHLMHWTAEFKKSELTLTKFCRLHKLDRSNMRDAICHLNYWELINKMKEKHEPKELSFVKVPNPQEIRKESANELSEPVPTSAISAESSVEVMEKQNDIEIMITKGVKVLISPNIDSMKIIKIIELLKEI